jgi:hypothetical protein
MASPVASSPDLDSNQPGSIVTIQKRVKVNVFIAMNKHTSLCATSARVISTFSMITSLRRVVNFTQQTDPPLQLGLLVIPADQCTDAFTRARCRGGVSSAYDSGAL